ncbi:trichohyalin-like [Salvelinus alpinus]|uniref:trichohyalin-like n=1 Tax=Salvelinus alpinus TaxID=8036 RepID=UPI0039FBD2FF
MEVQSIGQSDWHVEVGLLRKEVGLLKQWACMEETRRIERQKMEMYGQKVLQEVERDRLERMKKEEKKELAKINQMKDEELLLMEIRMRERTREMEEEWRRFREKSERQKVEKQMALQKKRQEERDEWEISKKKSMEEWKEFYRKEEDYRKEEEWMKAERKAKRKVEEGKRKMGEEQQMQKKQTSLTKKLSDGKRRNLEERKEDENNMGEKCVKEARLRDRRELLKEKRWRRIAEENLTHMEKQMMEREGEREREEERKHEEEMKMKRLEEDLMKEKKQRQIAEENMTHMEKQMRLESQIREDMRKHEEEMKMRKLEDMNNEMFGKMRELEERMIKMERQHAEKTTMEEEKEERKRVEDTVRMEEIKKTTLDVWKFHFGSHECPKTDDSKNEETPDCENSADEKKDNSVGVRQDSDTSVIEEINPKHEERDGDQNDDPKSDGKKYRSDAECSDGDDSKSAKTHQKKTDKEKNETTEALLTEEKDVSLVAAAESKTLNPQEDQPANCKDLSVFAAAGGKTQDSAKVKGEKDLDINVDWSETDYSCSDDEFMSEEIYPTDEEKGLLQLQTDGNTKEIGGETTDSDDYQRCRINSEKDEKDGYEKKEVIQENQRAKCKDFSIFSAGAQVTHSPCKARDKVKGENDRDIDWLESDNSEIEEVIESDSEMKEIHQMEEKKEKGEEQTDDLPSKRKTEKSDEETTDSSDDKSEKTNVKKDKEMRHEDITDHTLEKTDFSIFAEEEVKTESDHQLKRWINLSGERGMAKVPPVQQAKVSNKSEIVQKKDGNDKVTEPKTDAELIMEKYERMVEEGKRGLGQKERRDKEMAKGTEGKKKEVSKEEQSRLRNEKALQDHMARVENQEGTSKQTRQPQCKDYSIFTASGLKSKDPHDQQPVKCKGKT